MRGICCRNTNASGSQNLAKRGSSQARSSSSLAFAPSLKTTHATGRSDHFSCGTATTAASLTAGWPISAFSTSTELIHSPPLLIRSFERSVMRTYPSGSMVTTSPVRNQPSMVNLSASAGFRKYERATQGPRTCSSPIDFPSQGASP